MDQNDKKLIKKLVFMAGLASKFEEVDPLLEPLRLTTANLDESKPLPADKRAELQELDKKLSEFLTTKEKQHVTTDETLRVQVEQHLAEADKGVKARRILYVTLAASAVLFGLTAWLSGWDWLLAAAVALSGVVLGAAWQLVDVIHTFTPSLKGPFWQMCAGLALLALWLPMPYAAGLLGAAAGYLPPLVILGAGIIFYIGSVLYVKRIGVNNLFTNFYSAVVAAPVGLGLGWFLASLASTEATAIGAAAWGATLVLFALAAGAIATVVKNLPHLCKPPIRYLAAAAALVALLALFIIISPLIGTQLLVLLILQTAMALALTIACFGTNKISY